MQLSSWPRQKKNCFFTNKPAYTMKTRLISIVTVLAFSTPAAGDEMQKPLSTEMGRLIFDRHCATCHSLMPPPKTAPPVIGLAHHYHEAFDDRETGIAAMAEYLRNPDPQHSKLEAMAVKRFGIMPAMTQLEERERLLVSAWLWDQYDKDFTPPGCR